MASKAKAFSLKERIFICQQVKDRLVKKEITYQSYPIILGLLVATSESLWHAE